MKTNKDILTDYLKSIPHYNKKCLKGSYTSEFMEQVEKTLDFSLYKFNVRLKEWLLELFLAIKC